MSKVEFVIKTFGPKRLLTDESKFEKNIESRRSETKYKMPNIFFKSKLIKEEINNHDVYCFKNNSEKNKVIIYIHGGGYIKQASIFHLKFVDDVAKESNTNIYFPIYPLTPNHTYEESYDLMLKLYNNLLKENKEVILMGDSAGGGLALGFTQYLNELKIKLPSKLILISPWIDIAMTNEKALEYEDIDPMLLVNGIKKLGELWIGNLDPKDYKVSPLFGKFKNLPETILFSGDKEMFYPDINLLYDKLRENDVKTQLIVGEDLGHIYPIYPIDGKEAKEQIIKMIDD